MKKFTYLAVVTAILCGMVFCNFNPAMAQPAATAPPLMPTPAATPTPAPPLATAPAPPAAAPAPVATPPAPPATPTSSVLPVWMPEGTEVVLPYYLSPDGQVIVGLAWPDDPKNQLEQVKMALNAIKGWRNKKTANPLPTQVVGAVAWVWVSFPFAEKDTVQFDIYLENPRGKALTPLAQAKVSCTGLSDSQFSLGFHAALLRVVKEARVELLAKK
jgi:hypothetical protein